MGRKDHSAQLQSTLKVSVVTIICKLLGLPRMGQALNRKNPRPLKGVKIVSQGLQYTEQKKQYKVIFFLMKLKHGVKSGFCLSKTNFT